MRRIALALLARWPAVAALALAGCAHVDNQPSASEPFALVRFAAAPDAFPDQPVVKTFDGHSVKPDRDYRVKPGQYEVVCRMVLDTVQFSESEKVLSSNTSGKTTSVLVLGGGTMEHERRVRFLTNTLTVLAGWRYEINGEQVSKKFMQVR